MVEKNPDCKGWTFASCSAPQMLDPARLCLEGFVDYYLVNHLDQFEASIDCNAARSDFGPISLHGVYGRPYKQVCFLNRLIHSGKRHA
jgi:hypothetical protein